MPLWLERTLTYLACFIAGWVATFWSPAWTMLMLLLLGSAMCIAAAYEHGRTRK